jgi:hypothetical protein
MKGNMSRAIRRHHAARIKQARRFYYGLDNSLYPRRLGKVLHTATICSCYLCRNAADPTRAELVQAIELSEVE